MLGSHHHLFGFGGSRTTIYSVSAVETGHAGEVPLWLGPCDALGSTAFALAERKGVVRLGSTALALAEREGAVSLGSTALALAEREGAVRLGSTALALAERDGALP